MTHKNDEMLMEDMGRFYADPLGFVMYAYDWETDKTIQLVELQEPWASKYGCKFGPDIWACELLEDIGKEVALRGFDGIHAVAPLRYAVASGHGIGKSAFMGWLVDWIMSTRPYAKGVITANTVPQLETKTWAQVVWWTKKCITSHWFEVSIGGLWMRHKDHPESWRVDGQTCREENSESFAGLHAANSTPFFLYDESSNIADIIWEVSEGGTTDGEPMWFAFGNPTRNSGRFKDCFTKHSHRWNSRQIDSRNVQITNKKLLQGWIDDYGIDSDFVKVRVRGMFPSLSLKQFISTADVDQAFGRHLRAEQYNFAPKILTLDPAWEGDDELVFGLRQGLMFKILKTVSKNDNDIVIANMLADFEDQEQVDAVFVDAGYGTGIVSAGQMLGRTWQLVWFSSASNDPGCLNKRAEMWKLMRDWLKAGGAIPIDSVLYNDLVAPETVPRLDGIIQLESKKDMKKRGQRSPNRADSLALSFAYPVSAKARSIKLKPVSCAPDYNPFESKSKSSEIISDYDPFARRN